MNVTYGIMKGLAKIACNLSEEKANYMGELMGRLFLKLIPLKRKQISIQNILRTEITDDIKKAEEIAKSSALRFGPMCVSMFRFPLLDKKNPSKYANIEGKEYLDELVKNKKGCILATGHSGNWEMLGALLAMYGYPLLSVAMKQSNEGFDRFLIEYRSLTGQKIEYKTGVRDMYRRLKEGYFVALLCDQDPGKTGILSDFFNIPTLTATGPAHLSLLCDAPVVSVMIHQEKNKKYKVKIWEPIKAEKNLSKKESIKQITDIINKRLEEWIKKYPEEWFWLHRRCKSTDRLNKKA